MARYRKQQIHFFLTDRCNLSCDYCYTNKKDAAPSTLDLEFAELGIADFFSTNSSREIRFFGSGEPTMEFSLMKDIHSYAKGLAGDDLRVEIQTNGVFPEQVCQWISENVDIIWISHDGPRAHDLQRRTIDGKPSSGFVEQNIKRLLESPVFVGVRSTITPLNISRQTEIVEFFGGMGVKAIAADPVFVKVGDYSNGLVDLMEFAKNYLIASGKARELGIFYTSDLTTNFDEKTSIACQACLPCPHLTPDGYVSACDMATRGDTPLQGLIYGKYNKKENKIEYFPDKIALLRSRNLDNLEHCVQCEAKEHCAGTCLGETHNETGSIFGQRKDVCPAIRFLYKNSPRPEQIYPCLHP